MNNEMESSSVPVLELKNLVVHYETRDGIAEAVNNVSFRIQSGETLGLVGETGAGKTTIALTVMGLLPSVGSVIQGEVLLDGRNIVETSRSKRVLRKHSREIRRLCGSSMGMIFQDPMSALNPAMCVGEQIAEVVRLHQDCGRDGAKKRAVEMLEMVGIPKERYSEYPHQFSGGMKQRIVIATALACEPRLLIADEPTTALDITLQAQVLALIHELQQKMGTATLMITHDLGVVADICDKCAVIYAGEIVEYGTVEHIFNDPRHPYTLALFNALPSLNKETDRLHSIPGFTTDPMNLPSYCTFCERCPVRQEHRAVVDPPLREVSPGHFVKCCHVLSGEEVDVMLGTAALNKGGHR